MDAELREKAVAAIRTHFDTTMAAQIVVRALAPIIAEVEAAARADEREKAAKVAESYGRPRNIFGQEWAIATAIRAQKEPSA